MVTNANDNEPNPWRSIGWQAVLIVNRLRMKAQLLELAGEQEEQRQEPPEPGDKDKQRDTEHRRYVDQRLRELAAFERKAKGIKL